MSANLDKVVKPRWAAKTLSIEYTDLPDLGRPWTKRDVRELRDSRPEWLTAARRRHGAATEARAAAELEYLGGVLDRLGYTEPDAGTAEQAELYIDAACTHLLFATDCSEAAAERAAWARWPASMAAAAAEDEAQ